MGYIPREQAVFYNWQDNYMNVVVAESVGWGVPLADLTKANAVLGVTLWMQ